MSTVPTTEAPRPEPPARPEPLYVKLRPGPNGDHDAVASNQRSRLIGAMIEEVAERGYAATTLARLVALAGVSKRAFHELFGTKEAYFLATYDAIVANAVRRIGVAYRSEGDWRARLRASFAAYTAEVVEEPKAARLVLVEVLGAGPAALARMRRTRLIFEEMVSASFSEAPDGVMLPPLIAKAIVCGVERITRQQLLAGDVEELPALTDELLAWSLSYCSPAAAGLVAASPTRCDVHTPCCPRASDEGDWPRILRCAAEIAATKGFAQLSPARIASDAGVSTARFDELFESREQCFLDALDRLRLEAVVCATQAAQRTRGLAAVHAGIAALMRHIATNPVLVQVAFIEISALGRPASSAAIACSGSSRTSSCGACRSRALHRAWQRRRASGPSGGSSTITSRWERRICFRGSPTTLPISRCAPWLAARPPCRRSWAARNSPEL